MDPQDERAFRVFVDGRSRALLHAARLLTADRGAAEDLVQEALARLVPRWGRVENPEAYVRASMHRLQISRWRRRAVIVEDPVDDVHAGSVADHSHAVGDRLVLARALARLTPRQRSVLICRHIEDLDERETARRLGIRVGSVRSINQRALTRLRQLTPELADFRPGTLLSGTPLPAAAPPASVPSTRMPAAPAPSTRAPAAPTPSTPIPPARTPSDPSSEVSL